MDVTSPLTIASGTKLGLAGVVSGPATSVNVEAGGQLRLTGNNAYGGATTVMGGSLFIAGPGSIASSSGVSVTNNGTFDMSRAWNPVSI